MLLYHTQHCKQSSHSRITDWWRISFCMNEQGKKLNDNNLSRTIVSSTQGEKRSHQWLLSKKYVIGPNQTNILRQNSSEIEWKKTLVEWWEQRAIRTPSWKLTMEKLTCRQPWKCDQMPLTDNQKLMLISSLHDENGNGLQKSSKLH